MSDSASVSIDAIIRQFQLAGGRPFTHRPYGGGHINDTYLVSDGATHQYLLQRINHRVYTDVVGLMNNIRRVTEHLRRQPPTSATLTTLRVITTRDGSLFYQDAVGNYWRVLTFIRDSIAYDVANSPTQAQEAGRAFGQFLARLRDLPEPPLHETIPVFHHMKSRLDNFTHARQTDVAQRAGLVPDEITFVRHRADEMLALHDRVERGQIPRRVTHNDTKLNNVLLDPLTHQARCVVDLDTVMPGTVVYDFGDAVRTIASTAPEDEADLEKVQLRLPYYEAFARGYLSETRVFLTDQETKQLPFAGRYMTFMMGLRFLTDYLAGDVYYKTQHSEHNVQRARAQFRLITRMETRYEEMVDVVQRLVG